MSAFSSPTSSGLTAAFACLGLDGPVEAEALAAAFRATVKAARPDQGGDPERFRRIIAAYRLIQAHANARPALMEPSGSVSPPPVLAITPMQAVAGARIPARIGARALNIQVPAGLRTCQHLRLRGAADDGDDLYLPVLIRSADGLSVMGDDLFMRWPASPRVLADGGRIEIETHAGVRSAWVAPNLQAPVRLRLRNLGLPARGRRSCGHLFVTLDASSDAPSAAEDLLIRFTRAWTPERLAA